LGTQLIEWPQAFITGLTSAGLGVVVFDNRDAGLSTRCSGAYAVADMAGDVVGLMDHLDIEAAHVFGISMGGMIAQHVAFAHPDRVLSLMSVMSSSGDPDLPQPSVEVRARLQVTGATEEEIVRISAENKVVWGSPGYPESEADRLAAARRAYARSFRPDGVARQMQAVIKDGSRVERLASICCPTLVIHGADDALIPVAAGIHTARCIPGSVLEVIPGMGHNLPAALAPKLVDLVVGFIPSSSPPPASARA
jgi:pimeloyl-ACP methyl ester carboxylesterase